MINYYGIMLEWAISRSNTILNLNFKTAYIINVKNYKLISHLKVGWNCKSGKSSYAGFNYSVNYPVNRLMMGILVLKPIGLLNLVLISI